jgi:hypothetical protein
MIELRELTKEEQERIYELSICSVLPQNEKLDRGLLGTGLINYNHDNYGNLTTLLSPNAYLVISENKHIFDKI